MRRISLLALALAAAAACTKTSRISLLALALAAAAACGPPKESRKASPPPTPEANLIIIVNEVVQNEQEDGFVFTLVYLNGTLRGQTDVGAKSSQRSWETWLAPGNYLLRLEQWAVPQEGEPSVLARDFQPRERFVKVEGGKLTEVRLKFFDRGRRNSLKIARIKILK